MVALAGRRVLGNDAAICALYLVEDLSEEQASLLCYFLNLCSIGSIDPCSFNDEWTLGEQSVKDFCSRVSDRVERFIPVANGSFIYAVAVRGTPTPQQIEECIIVSEQEAEDLEGA